MAISFGLPRMHKEAGERRDFLPELVEFLGRIGAGDVVVEDGYGAGLGLTTADYTAQYARCRVGSYDECLAQDVVVVLRYPSNEAVAKLRRGAVLVSMVHYPTRPARVADLEARGVHAVSLDSVADDLGRRLVENLEAVGWGGVRSAFRALGRTWPELESPGRRPVRALVLGAGAVGAHAVRAAASYGDGAWRQALAARGLRGVEVTVADFDLTFDGDYLREQLAHTDVLIDATLRPDASRPVVPNTWLGALPRHAVMVDLAVDPYDFTASPPTVKGLEGIPEGNLDQFEFSPEDPAWDRLDRRVDTRNRRTALSCYSWPGILPRECMAKYSLQVQPVLRVLVEVGIDRLDPATGPFYERAVARAEVSRWRRAHPR